ncbi:two component transcriptional regulator, winged helix family [Acidimicrobium ferrooxidans DSM 10331]|uniref:Two component transcriptional regulator, winged helix family n=1 Tax=Acidimicrobium ferrooxidans (strain DSM 10331 / JCM 15462 / NBRC 103882 / ICP) TaxID=525909 RepID=C7M3B8_ACIFD|nr:response regulator transcription factor [Acidimicrobium ferrooxidans]ACU53512.1 two component transcriptional regulator, winged helix family [Acidimicrobium ferrooxidans DSM 10331]
MDSLRKPAKGVRVLVVDDELPITELLQMALTFEGYDVSVASSGREALDVLRTVKPDLLILDVMMPGMDGFTLLRRLREERNDVPVLLLTAKDAVEDRVQGLQLGSDDYVTKPFSLAELVARVEAILRRSGQGTGAPTRIVVGDLVLDEDAHQVLRAGHEIELTATEFKLLRYLMLNANKVVSKAQILDHVWQYDFGGDANIVETYISYLRKKLDGYGPPMIKTVRGVGYSLRAAESA